MPRATSSTKRKEPPATQVSDDHDSDKAQASKKPRLPTPPPGAQPTNKTLPDEIRLPEKTPGTLRIASWNVCGLAASIKKGFSSYIVAEDPDILLLTETKLNVASADTSLKARFPHAYWSIADKKGYAGTAIFSKRKPLSVTTTLPGLADPSVAKGRIITLEFENSYLIGCYVPNAGDKLKSLDVKNNWNEAFTVYIRDLDKKKPVIWCGDLNVAPTEMDLTNAKRNWNKSAGYTEAETTAFKNILNPPDGADGNKFVDIWRQLHPTDKHYTYFSYRFNCRSKGLGWRLDMFVLSERIVDQVRVCEIRSEIYGASDHCPLVMEIEGAL